MGIKLSGAVYDKLRVIVQIWIPALAVFYSALAGFWGFGYVTEVVGTLSAIAVLVGTLLGISRKNYNTEVAAIEASANAVLDAGTYDGALVVNESDPLTDTFVLHMDTPFQDLKNKDTISLRVKNESGSAPLAGE